MGAPSALSRPQLKFQNAPVHKKIMRDPVLRPGLAVAFRTLDVDRLVAGVEIGVPHGCHLARHLVADADLLEEWRSDQVDVLSVDRKETHHAQHGECAHRAAVVVPRDSWDGCVELGWDVEVCSRSGEARSAGIVELENRQESLFVAHVENPRIMQVRQSRGECLWTAETGDERGHIVRYVAEGSGSVAIFVSVLHKTKDGNSQCVEPAAPLVGLVSSGIEIARGKVVQRTTKDRILESPCSVEVARL